MKRTSGYTTVLLNIFKPVKLITKFIVDKQTNVVTLLTSKKYIYTLESVNELRLEITPGCGHPPEHLYTVLMFSADNFNNNRGS